MHPSVQPPRHFSSQPLSGIQRLASELPRSGHGWMGPLEVSWSNSPAQVGPLTAGCPGPHPNTFEYLQDGDSTASALALPVLGRRKGPPQPGGNAPNAAQDTVVLCSKGTLVACGQLGVHQDLSSKATFQLVASQHVLVHGVVPPHVEEEEHLQNI